MFFNLTKVIMTVLSVTLLVFSFQNCSPSSVIKFNSKSNKSKISSTLIYADSLFVTKNNSILQ